MQKREYLHVLTSITIGIPSEIVLLLCMSGM